MSEITIDDIEAGDKVSVGIAYCGQTYTVEIRGDPQEEWEEWGSIGGTVRSSADPPEAPNVGADVTLNSLENVERVF